MPTRRQLIGASAASIALTGVGASPLRTFAQDATSSAGTDDQQSGAAPVVGTPVLRPTIDLIRAQQIALEGNPGAVVTKVELDGNDGVLEYSVKLNNGIEVDIDATTGTVIKTEPADSEDDGNSDNGGDDEGANHAGDDSNSGDDHSDDGEQDDGD